MATQNLEIIVTARDKASGVIKGIGGSLKTDLDPSNIIKPLASIGAIFATARMGAAGYQIALAGIAKEGAFASGNLDAVLKGVQGQQAAFANLAGAIPYIGPAARMALDAFNDTTPIQKAVESVKLLDNNVKQLTTTAKTWGNEAEIAAAKAAGMSEADLAKLQEKHRSGGTADQLKAAKDALRDAEKSANDIAYSKGQKERELAAQQDSWNPMDKLLGKGTDIKGQIDALTTAQIAADAKIAAAKKAISDLEAAKAKKDAAEKERLEKELAEKRKVFEAAVTEKALTESEKRKADIQKEYDALRKQAKDLNMADPATLAKINAAQERALTQGQDAEIRKLESAKLLAKASGNTPEATRDRELQGIKDKYQSDLDSYADNEDMKKRIAETMAAERAAVERKYQEQIAKDAKDTAQKKADVELTLQQDILKAAGKDREAGLLGIRSKYDKLREQFGDSELLTNASKAEAIALFNKPKQQNQSQEVSAFTSRFLTGAQGRNYAQDQLAEQKKGTKHLEQIAKAIIDKEKLTVTQATIG